MCLIDNELTDCGGKWISNDTNSFKVVPEGAIDSVEVCIVVRVDVVKQCSLGPLSYSGITYSQ